MLDIITKKSTVFIIMNGRTFRYILTDDNGSLILRFLPIQEPIYRSKEFFEIQNYVTSNLHKRTTLKDITAAFYTNKRSVEKLFRENVGMTFHEYITELRLGTAIAMLFTPQKSITEIAAETGFSSSQNFCKFFSKHLSLSPSKFRTVLQARIFETLKGKTLNNLTDYVSGHGIHLFIQAEESAKKLLKSSVYVTPPPPKIRGIEILKGTE